MATTLLDRFTGSVVADLGKQPCDTATTGPITLAGYQIIGDVNLNQDYLRCLVNDQIDQTENGIYVVTSAEWYRAGDFNGPSGTVSGQLVYVTGGLNVGLWQLVTPNPVQIDQSGGQSTPPSDIEFSFLQAFIDFSGISSTCNTIGLGLKTFITQPGLDFSIGQFIIVAESSNPANYMYGQIISYVDDTLVINSLSFAGSGIKCDWNISFSGPPGPSGADGTDGTNGTDGVGVPAGGTINQYLKKNSSTNYDTSWADLPSFPAMQSGYQLLPSGVILQWGSIASGGSDDGSSLFPITFPNACLSIVGNPNILGGYTVTFPTYSATGYSYSRRQSPAMSATPATSWFAIGY